MLSKRRRYWLFSAVAFLIVLIVLIAKYPEFDQICSKDEYTGAKNCAAYDIVSVTLWHILKFLNDFGVAVTALATVAIGVFTSRLFAATDAMQRIAGDQSRDLKRSIEITEKAAEAAIKQAITAERALTHLERPYIFIFDVSEFLIDIETGEFYVTYSIANYGKMPAIIESASAGFEFSDRVAFPVPSFVEDGHNFMVAPILQAGEKREKIREYIPANMSKGVVVDLLDTGNARSGPDFDVPEGNDVAFRVVIEYRGPFKRGHETGGLWMTNFPRPGLLAQRGDEEYNYVR